MKFDLAGFAVHRWQFTLVAFGLLVMLGLNAFSTVPRSEDPHFPVPIVIIRAVLPGAEPSEMEQLVADPIEDAVDGLDDIDKVESTSLDGAAVIRVHFTWNVDPERKYDQVVREVNAIRGNLPAGLARLDIDRVRTTEVAIVQVALTSDVLPMRRLEKVADRLRERLDRVPGVRQSRYYGAPPSEVRVSLDLARLSALKLPATAVSDALKAAGAEAPIGAVQAGDRRFNVKAGGAFRSLDVVKDTPVRSIGGQVVRVRDVAEVAWAQDEPTHLTRFNGKRAIFVTVTQKDGQDVAKITASVDKVLDDYEKSLPAGVKLERGFVQAKNVEHRLNNLFRDFGIALLLVMITLLPLGPRAGLVVMVSIPLSLLIGLVLLQAFGFTLNQLSIAGFVLALGLLVDDSIVITENIARRIREGEERTAAAVNGANQIALAVLGCTACLMLAFLPLMALPAGSGAYIKSLPVTVLCTVGASLLVSMTIIPFLASRVLDKHSDPEGNPLLRAVNGGIHRFYRPVLHFSLARPWLSLAIMLAICATTVPMLKIVGSSLFPAAETPQFLVRVETPDGSPLARTDRALRFVEARLRTEPDITWQAQPGSRQSADLLQHHPARERHHLWRGVRQPEGLGAGQERARAGPPARRLRPLPRGADQRRHLRERPADRRPGGRAPDRPEPGGAEGPGRAHREDPQGHARHARRQQPVRLDRTDLDLGVDEGKAAALGVPAGAPRRAARLALSGEETGRFRDPDGDDYAVKVRLPMGLAEGKGLEGSRNALADLSKIYVPTADGEAAPLGSIATPDPALQPGADRPLRPRADGDGELLRPDRLPDRQGHPGRGRPPGPRAAHAARLSPVDGRPGRGPVGKLRRPGRGGDGGGVRDPGGAGPGVPEVQDGAGGGRDHPVRPVRGGRRLWITGYSLSFTATIGLIALIGIEIKNSILLVDFTEQLRKGGMGLHDAIEKAGEVRFLPVLLTSVTAIGGLLPLAMEGSGLYSPLAIVIIGGLITSTVLSRVATPVMYWLTARGDAEHV
jgi:multidrug efflux pump subunit AcrB